ncbi:MAG: GAF domain-containing protein [Verrucomicrobia bacterium]|nr:GAF domain-containing protein [Verrucomicrobiota bacterium]
MNVSSAQSQEAPRLDALQCCHILDTPLEGIYDDLVQLAATLCQTPLALISFIDRDRQWIKAEFGFGQRYESPREISFCTHAVAAPDGLLIVPDTHADPRFADNPFVRQEPRLRFYAGIVVRSSAGHALGTLCVMDRRPRQLSTEQLLALRQLSRQLAAHLATRRIVAELERAVVEHQLMEAELRATQKERERLVTELRDALGHVKTLKGFLPICASCKNIRDDAGYWQQIESYLREHSEVEFTHGICPRCAERLYPEFNRFDDQPGAPTGR